MLDIIKNLEESLHFHLPNLQLFHKWGGVVFYFFIHRPRRSILLLSLPYSRSLRSLFFFFFFKEVFVSLQFQSPFAMLCTL